MTSKLLKFTIPVSLLFYCVIPLLYLFPRIAENKAVGTAMLMVAFVLVAPTWVALVVRICRLGLRAGGVCRSGSRV
jgi:hypothetical protein